MRRENEERTICLVLTSSAHEWHTYRYNPVHAEIYSRCLCNLNIRRWNNGSSDDCNTTSSCNLSKGLDRVLEHKLKRRRLVEDRRWQQSPTDAFKMTIIQRNKVVLISTQTTINKQMTLVLIGMIVPPTMVLNDIGMITWITWLITTLRTIYNAKRWSKLCSNLPSVVERHTVSCVVIRGFTNGPSILLDHTRISTKTVVILVRSEKEWHIRRRVWGGTEFTLQGGSHVHWSSASSNP